MYLHIGNDKMLDLNKIILILDYKKLKKADCLPKHMIVCNNPANKKVTTDEECKSVIITDENIIFSPISPMTLLKRVYGKSAI
ncbi:MAG: extracellular matrix regulator RemB [Bacillota bacterium]|jgi:hypothetical protein